MLSQRKWQPDSLGYAVGKIGGKKVKMHRIVMQAKEGEIVDHINGIVTDNRRENLRIVNAYQSSVNRASVAKTSQYKGVYFSSKTIKGKVYGYWYAKVKKHGKDMYRKGFKTELEAALAYDVAALEHHGEYARLNFPKIID